jgi:hypothetical protein
VTDLIQLTAEPDGPVDDPTLDALDDEARADAALFSPMGPETADSSDDDTGVAYQLELMKPLAVDLRRLCERADQPVPPIIDAALGPRRALLLCHAMTAFAPPGQRPAGVWGMGYQVELVDVADANTVALAPDSQVEEIGSVQTKVELGVSVGGKLSLPAAAITGVPLPLSIPGAELTTSTDSNFSVCIRLTLGLVQVQAGPVGAGGARWNLYRHGQDLRRSQALVQTVLVPDDLERLEVSVRTWVRKRSWLGGLRRAHQWISKPERYQLSLT